MTFAGPSHVPQIAFRTDASIDIGTGHVMRSLTLADTLRESGAECLFVSREHHGNLIEMVAARGHRAATLPPGIPVVPLPHDPAHAAWLGSHWQEDAFATREALGSGRFDWLVVDHYAIDERWERALRSSARHLMVMDDLADRRHDCDLLLDPTLGRTEAEYRRVVPSDTQLLLGPQYALLRPEFAAAREESLRRRAHPELRRLLITLGGVDKDNATGRVLDALDICLAGSAVAVTVVLGPHAPWRAQVRDRVAQMRVPTEFRVGVNDMARLMTESDLAIGAAGGTSWECCCLGLPALTLSLAENQHEMARSLEAAGAAITVTSVEEGAQLLKQHLDRDRATGLLSRMIPAAAGVTAGRGAEILSERMLVR